MWKYADFDENRDISSVLNYKNGKLHGECISYYDGIPGIGYGLVFCKGKYSHGKRHGEFIWVNNDGTIKEIKEYNGINNIKTRWFTFRFSNCC